MIVKLGPEASQMAQAPAAKPDDLSSVPRNHIVEGENRFCQFDL